MMEQRENKEREKQSRGGEERRKDCCTVIKGVNCLGSWQWCSMQGPRTPTAKSLLEKNIDKGQVGRKTGLCDIFYIERVFVICYENILFQLHEMIVNKALTNEKIFSISGIQD